ncbi:MAG: 2-dehydropantoate 2-reductase [SAR324 cluster bacterium]|nr:2-dehydropantoate 2-reductase [SAR324 cluster bacterium]
MKIAIMGSGGIGGYLGGLLAKSGEEVTFIARGPHLETMRNKGLRVESTVSGDFSVSDVQATDDPGEVGEVELVVMTTKAYDLEAAAEAIQPMVGQNTVVLPLLNGVDISERIGTVVGIDHVLGGLVLISSSVAEPGVIRQIGPKHRIVFGELSGEATPRARSIEAVLKSVKIDTFLTPNIEQELWKKFIFVTPMAGVGGVIRKASGLIRSDPDTLKLLTGCMLEIDAVARKKGVELPENIIAETFKIYDGLPPGGKPSMVLDLERGNRLELDALNGTVVRMGKQLNVPTPVNQFIYAALKLHAGGT